MDANETGEVEITPQLSERKTAKVAALERVKRRGQALVVSAQELKLWRTAAACSGYAGRLGGFIRLAVHEHAIRVLLAAEHRPCRLRKGARIWKLKDGCIELWDTASGNERVWPRQEISDAPVELSPTRRAWHVDVVAPFGDSKFVSTEDLLFPSQEVVGPSRPDLTPPSVP